MEVVLRRKGLWKYKANEEAKDAEASGTAKASESEVQKRGLALANIMTFESTTKSMIQKIRCPCEAWHRLETMVVAESKSALDAKLSMIQNIHVEEGKSIDEYLSKILELVTQLEDAGHTISKIVQKNAFAQRASEWL